MAIQPLLPATLTPTASVPLAAAQATQPFTFTLVNPVVTSGTDPTAAGQTSITQTGATSTYLYDAEGRRVQKVSGGQTTTYVYDAMGNLAAAYGGTDAPACSTCYLTPDHLGSTRLITDANGNVVSRYDYTPFGSEIGPSFRTVNGTALAGYAADWVNPKFTGKPRDYETTLGLDYFGARYFSAAMGRFTTPDWSAKPQPVPYARLDNPQSLNLYAYVLNNPLVHRDADGHIIDDSSLANNKAYQKWKTEYLSHDKAKTQRNALNDNKNLTVHMGWDSKGTQSVTGGYQWSSSGNLTSVNVTLAAKTGNLDYSTGTEILEQLWRSCVERGQTGVLVTHDAKAAAYRLLCDRKYPWSRNESLTEAYFRKLATTW